MMFHVVRSIPVTEDDPARPGASDDRTEVVAIIAEFRMALGELRCVGSERMVKQGVSMTNLHVLSILDHHGTLTMSRLAELLDVSLSNATGLVDRMEERGWVERERDREDRRVVSVRLAEGGRQKLNDIQLVKEELVEKILLRLDGEALQCVRSALRSLRGAALDVAADPAVAAHWHAHTHAH
jgi:DNA-binding MarR family transcriptional regulator